jgi:hypothetical protein
VSQLSGLTSFFCLFVISLREPKLFKKYNIREVTSSKSSQKMEKVEASETNLKETLALFV